MSYYGDIYATRKWNPTRKPETEREIEIRKRVELDTIEKARLKRLRKSAKLKTCLNQ